MPSRDLDSFSPRLSIGEMSFVSRIFGDWRQLRRWLPVNFERVIVE